MTATTSKQVREETKSASAPFSAPEAAVMLQNNP